MTDKQALRAELKRRRADFVASIPGAMRGLMFRRPPEALQALVPEGAVISVFHEMAGEVPASNYARWFFEAGHRVALPWFAARNAAMEFRGWDNPWDDQQLVPGPWRMRMHIRRAARTAVRKRPRAAVRQGCPADCALLACAPMFPSTPIRRTLARNRVGVVARVLLAGGGNVDKFTAHGNYSADVIDLGKWFNERGGWAA